MRAALVGATLVGTVAAMLPQTAALAAVNPDVTVGTAPQRPADVAAVSSAPATSQLSFDVALAPRDPQALAAFVTAVSTPGSPQYRKFLAPKQFGPRFGATPTTIASVTAALRSRGLSVGAASSNGLSIPASGTVEQVSAALRTSFKQYRLRSGRTGLANVSAPRLPATVAAQVQGFVGLNQLTHAITDHPAASGTAPAPAADPTPPPAPAGPTACAAANSTATATHAFTPAQIAQHYGIDSLYASTMGQGATVALFELEPFDPTDIAAYQSCFHTATPIAVRPVAGGVGAGTGSGEAALDIEELIGLAPAANLLVYEAPNDGASVYDEFKQIADDDAAQVISDSWGLCEAESGVPELAALERPILQQMAAQGQTVLAATGDSGSEGCFAPPDSSDTSLSIWEPASQPEVTSVGGTSMPSVSGADTSWNNVYGATGGGVSTLWQMPAYQHLAATTGASSSAPCGAPAAVLCRQTPDVSATADVAHGSLAYYGGAWHAVGGTSAATPIWASVLALINATCTAGSVGFANPALYQLAAAGSPALVDVSVGPDNDFTGDHPGDYPTTSGYDLTTGLGRPNAAALRGGLCPAVGKAGSGTMTVTPPLVQPATATTLTFSYSPAPGQGMVDGELDLTVPGTWTLPTTVPTTAGYTTSSSGVLSIVGTTIVVTGLTVPVGGSVTITYGDTSGGAAQAQTPSVPQISVFGARSRVAKTGATAPLAINPAVRVIVPGAAAAGAVLTRTAGVDRIATSIAASESGFPSDGSAGAVVLARSDLYPDALAGVPLAAQNDGPLLLSPSSGLTTALIAEIERVLPVGRKVFLLGSSASLSMAIDTQLQTMGYLPVRLQGPTRYDTAIKIANALGSPATVFEVDGTNFPDALSAGPAAVITHGAVVFTNGTTAAPVTAGYLAAHPSDVRYAVGGPAVAADPTAAKLAGVDRYETSVLVAQSFFVSPSVVGAASALKFPDALSGGPITALAGGPIILVPPDGPLPTQTQAYLSQAATTVLSAWLFGGTPSVSTLVADEVAQSLVLVPPAS